MFPVVLLGGYKLRIMLTTKNKKEHIRNDFICSFFKDRLTAQFTYAVLVISSGHGYSSNDSNEAPSVCCLMKSYCVSCLIS